jgi:hypothetical protein
MRIFRVYDATATGVCTMYLIPNESLIATHVQDLVPVHTATATLQK